MSFSKINEIRQLKNHELENEIVLLKRELFELRLRKGTRQKFKSHFFQHIKRRLRQIFIVQNERITEFRLKD